MKIEQIIILRDKLKNRAEVELEASYETKRHLVASSMALGRAEAYNYCKKQLDNIIQCSLKKSL